MSEQPEDDTYLEADAEGSDGSPLALAHVLRSFADTLEKAPQHLRYDFELHIDEKETGMDSNQEGDQ